MEDKDNNLELEKDLNNQDIQDGKWGGKRPNAGRKPGEAESVKIRRKFREYITEDKVNELVEIALEQSKTKAEVLKFILEQLFGKAPQSVELEGGAKFILEIAKQVADKHE